MIRNFFRRIYWGIRYLFTGNFYSLRRGVIWPEHQYKAGMLRRVQKMVNAKYFIETGTYLGDTAATLTPCFKKILTIELDDKLFHDSRERLVKYKNVECFHGNSKEVLSTIIKRVDKAAIFFLDAHYSGPGTGQSKNPILDELEIISKNPIKDHVIVVDDISDFSASGEEGALSKLIQSIEDINPEYRFYFDYDMLFAIPNDSRRIFWEKVVYPFVIR